MSEEKTTITCREARRYHRRLRLRAADQGHAPPPPFRAWARETYDASSQPLSPKLRAIVLGGGS